MADAKQIFRTAVEKIFNNWSGLQMAVEHGMGGRNGHKTAIEIMDYVYKLCIEQDNIGQSEILDVLEEVMDNEFNTIFEDGSLEEISGLLTKFLSMCREGKLLELQTELNRLPSGKEWLKADFVVPRIRDEDGSSSSSEDDDDMDVDVQEPQAQTSSKAIVEPVAEEDPGWTTVRRKKK